MAKREFTVRWLAQFELVVKAKDEEQAIIEATNRTKDGDLVEYFDSHTVEEQRRNVTTTAEEGAKRRSPSPSEN